MTEIEPGIRRLCVVLAARKAGLLASACHSGGWGRLLVQADPRGSIETGVAQPGVDEVALFTGLVADLQREILADPESAGQALLAVDVGIVRMAGDGFGGAGLARTRALARNGAIRAAALHRARERGAAGGFAVVISDGLFADLRAEGIPAEGWQRVWPAAAWLRSFDAASGPEKKQT